MSSWTRHVSVPAIVRGALALLLLWAAVSKLGNPTQFLGSVYAYELPLPRGLIKAVAVILPWVELLCGLLLLSRVWSESTLMLVGAMLVGFVVVTGLAWARGLRISCGCFDLSLFGVNREHAAWLGAIESPGFAFLRNLALLAATGYLLRSDRAAPGVPPDPSDPPQPPGSAGPLPLATQKAGPQKAGHRRRKH